MSTIWYLVSIWPLVTYEIIDGTYLAAIFLLKISYGKNDEVQLRVVTYSKFISKKKKSDKYSISSDLLDIKL